VQLSLNKYYGIQSIPIALTCSLNVLGVNPFIS